MEEMMKLCDIVRETGYSVHRYFRHGYPEKVYENSLANRLRKQGLEVEQQKSITVHDEDGTPVGYYLADLVIAGRLIIELKTVSALVPEHEAQILGYLRTSRLEHALLINFGSRLFQIRKYAQLADVSLELGADS